MADEKQLEIQITAVSNVGPAFREATAALDVLNKKLGDSTAAFFELGKATQIELAAAMGIKASSLETAQSLLASATAAASASQSYTSESAAIRAAAENLKLYTAQILAAEAAEKSASRQRVINSIKDENANVKMAVAAQKESYAVTAEARREMLADIDAKMKDAEATAKMVLQEEKLAEATRARSLADSQATQKSKIKDESANTRMAVADIRDRNRMLLAEEAANTRMAVQAQRDETKAVEEARKARLADIDAKVNDAEATAKMVLQEEKLAEATRARFLMDLQAAQKSEIKEESANTRMAVQARKDDAKAVEEARRVRLADIDAKMKDAEATAKMVLQEEKLAEATRARLPRVTQTAQKSEMKDESANTRMAVADIRARNRTLLAEEAANTRMAVQAQRDETKAVEEARVIRLADIDAKMKDAEATAKMILMNERATASSGTARREMRHVVAAMDELSSGKKGQFVATLGASLRDAGLGAAGLATGMIAIMGALAVGKVVQAAENMGKLAVETRAGAAAAGMSIEKYSQLHGALDRLGLKEGEADGAMRKFARSLDTAVADSTSKQAAAFHAFGVSQQFLKDNAQDTGKVLEMMADRWGKYQDGSTKAAAGSLIFGNSLQKIIPILQDGAVQLKANEDEATRLGLVMDTKMATAFEHSGKLAKDLSDEMGASARRTFSEWEGTVDGTLVALKKMVQGFEALGKGVHFVVSGIATDLRFLWDTATSVAKSLENLAGKEPKISSAMPPALAPKPAEPLLQMSMERKEKKVRGGATELGRAHEEVAAAKEAAASGTPLLAGVRASSIAESKAAIGVLEQILSSEKLTSRERLAVETQLSSAKTKLRHEEMAEAAAITRKQASEEKQAARDRISAIKQNAEDARSMMTAALAIQRFATTAETGGGAQGSAQQAEEVIRIGRTEIAMLEEVARANTTSAEDRKTAEREILSVVADTTTKAGELYRMSAEEAKKAAAETLYAYTKIFKDLDNSLSTFSKDYFAAAMQPHTEMVQRGLTTVKVKIQGDSAFQSAARKLFLGLADDLVSSVAKSMEKLAAQKLASTLGVSMPEGGGGFGSLLGGMITGGSQKPGTAGFSAENASGIANSAQKAMAALRQEDTAIIKHTNLLQTSENQRSSIENVASTKETALAAKSSSTWATTEMAKTGATTAGVSSRTSATLAGSAAEKASTVSTAESSILAKAASAASGAYDAMAGIPVVGPVLGAAAAAATFAAVLGYMAVAGSAEGGWGEVPADGTMAILHKKEMVLPANLATPLRAALTGTHSAPPVGGLPPLSAANSNASPNLARSIAGMMATNTNTTNNHSNSANMNYSPTVNVSGGGNGMSKADFRAMFNEHMVKFASESRNLIRDGWRPHGTGRR